MSLERAANSTVDPKDDVHNPLHYIPSNAPTTIALCAYLIVSSALLFRSFTARWRASYMLCVIIGGFCMCLGLVVRYPLHHNPDSLGTYVVENLFVVLSPCAFIAGNYALLGRLARHVGTEEYLLVRATLLTKVFLGSDIATFFLQAAGGSMSTVFKLGMIAQLISYLFFTLTFSLWLQRTRAQNPRVWTISHSLRTNILQPEGHHSYIRWTDWRALAGALAISCVGILIRSVYRTIEGLQGYDGALATNEHTFYLFDSLPLLIAIGVYALFWPGSYIDSDRLAAGSAGYSHELLAKPAGVESTAAGVRLE